ncbi:response regulator [Desulfovibrio sp. A2]|nr:response regulator [Desulfovibrio sp. A2]
MSKTVVLVEDLDIVREGLKALLGAYPAFTIVGEAPDGIQALKIVEKHTPDIVLMDLTLPLMDGTEAIREIKRRCEHTKVLALTAHKKDSLIYRTLSAGADGYVLKNVSSDILVQAMETVLSGRRYISPEISELLIEDFLRHGRRESGSLLDLLSDREKQVLKLVAEGHGNKMIADKLCISHKTVEKHKANLKRKLGADSTAELVSFAIEHGLTVTP